MASDDVSSGSVLDVDGTLARFDGDKGLFAEMAGFILEDAPPLFDRLRGAVSDNDASAVRANAHALKGLVAGCGGARAASVAQALENAGQANDLRHSAELIRSMRTELSLLMQALRSYLA